MTSRRYSNLDTMKTILYIFALVFVLIRQVHLCMEDNICPPILQCVNRSLNSINITCEQKSVVRRLAFDFNNIKTVNFMEFNDLQNLEVISLKANNLEFIEEAILWNKSKLWTINLSQNNITYVNSSFFGRSPISKLQLEDNRIKTIYSGSFVNLWKLHTVYLSRNEIEVIEENAFSNNSRVRELYVDNNRLRDVSFLKNMHYLNYLNLSFNRVQVIPKETFTNLTNLTTLYCNNNKLVQLEFLIFLGSLKKINLSYNLIIEIRIEVFNYLVNLEKLYLAHNQISHIGSGTFSEMKQLTSIDLSYNKIVLIGEILEHSSIREIHLEYNHLTNISIPHNLKRDLTLYINGNNWTCQFIKNVLDDHKAILSYTNMTNTTNFRGVACRDGFANRMLAAPAMIITTTETIKIPNPKEITTAVTTETFLHIVLIGILSTAFAITIIFTIVKVVSCGKRTNHISQSNCQHHSDEDKTPTKKMTDSNHPQEDVDGYLVPTQMENLYDEIQERPSNDYV